MGNRPMWTAVPLDAGPAGRKGPGHDLSVADPPPQASSGWSLKAYRALTVGRLGLVLIFVCR
jgi:hypothetical protein